MENSHGPMRRTKSSLLAFKLREVSRARAPGTPTHHHCLTIGAHPITRRSLATQFLDTKEDVPTAAGALPGPSMCEPNSPSSPPARRPRLSPPLSLRQNVGDDEYVWVDCFYYGFYVPKRKLAQYQKGSMQGRPAHHPESGWLAAH